MNRYIQIETPNKKHLVVDLGINPNNRNVKGKVRKLEERRYE